MSLAKKNECAREGRRVSESEGGRVCMVHGVRWSV